MPLQNFGVVASRSEDAFEDYLIVRAAQPDAAAMRDLYYALLPSEFVSYRLSASDESDVTLDAEVEALSGLPGCRVVHDPRLGNGMNPKVEDLQAIAEAVNGLYVGSGSTGEDRPTSVLVHCIHGRERTGAVCAAWRLIYGAASLADVEADLKAYGVTGLTAIVDHEILEAVREIARRVGK